MIGNFKVFSTATTLKASVGTTNQLYASFNTQLFGDATLCLRVMLLDQLPHLCPQLLRAAFVLEHGVVLTDEVIQQ